MNGFLWASGHLGWGIFAIAVFTALWVLFADLVWRLKNARIVRVAIALSAGWLAGVVLIVLGFWLASQ